ncbi:hypothetical protein [Streptomyces alboflavus]|uniref:hypothetical protein n=1 Tax=Streptomyces alboflavus TaxID=67267 RepID=UPI000F656297|nr:hypothetical protein [Streptomyces alboflavus]
MNSRDRPGRISTDDTMPSHKTIALTRPRHGLRETGLAAIAELGFVGLDDDTGDWTVIRQISMSRGRCRTATTSGHT